MEFFRVYGRVIGLLRDERGLAITLALANIAVAALQFYEPVLFGKVVDLLSGAQSRPTKALWHDAVQLLLLWAAVGLGGIAANIVVSLQADRMAHRRRLGAMARYFEHVLVLPRTLGGGGATGDLGGSGASGHGYPLSPMRGGTTTTESTPSSSSSCTRTSSVRAVGMFLPTMSARIGSSRWPRSISATRRIALGRP